MKESSSLTYTPVNVLKRIADDVWIVDGPSIDFGFGCLKMQFPTRMTLIRLRGDELFVHSPTALTTELNEQTRTLGRPRWIVAPNRIHYWWIPDWHEAFPEAEVFLAPGVRERADDRIRFDCAALDRSDGYPWQPEIATLLVAGSYMTEAVFLHRASGTLVLTDLIENFEPHRLPSRLMRWLTRWAGAQDPDGSMPIDLRMTFARRKPELRRAIEQMIAWDPQRIVLAHGRWYTEGGAAELRRAFAWLLR